MKRANSQGLKLIAGVAAAEVVVSLFTESEVGKAVAVATVLALFFMASLVQSSIIGRFSIPKPSGLEGVFFILMAAGFYAVLLGILRHNDVYYFAADIYHWWVELIFIAYFTFAVGMHIRPAVLVKGLLTLSVILGSLTLLVVVLGSLGLATGGGHQVQAIGVWRLEASRGYPILLIILLFCSLRAKIELSLVWRWVRVVAFVLLMLALALTLKRTLWLVFLGANVFIFAPKRYLTFGLVSLPFVLGGVIMLYVLVPGIFQTALGEIASKLTYNPNYLVEDSLGERIQQVMLLAPYIGNWMGYGFGAVFYTYWPAENTFGYVHYIHNLYVFNILQLGYIGFVLFVLAYFMLGRNLWKIIGSPSEYEWLARGVFAAIAAMMASGMTIVSTHTVFNGLVVGLGMIVVAQVRSQYKQAISHSVERGC